MLIITEITILFKNFVKKHYNNQYVIMVAVITVFFSGGIVIGQVENTNILIEFQKGTTISSEDVNYNFNLIKALVEDTDNKLLVLSERIMNGAPSGTIIAFAGTSDKIPDGWLLCNGDALPRPESATDPTYNLFQAIGLLWGGNASTFNLPDLRGRFLRGDTGNTANDPDSASRTDISGNIIGKRVGSYQNDAFQGHHHSMNYALTWHQNTYYHNVASGGWYQDASSPITALDPITNGAHGIPRTSNETRPKNASVNFIIKL